MKNLDMYDYALLAEASYANLAGATTNDDYQEAFENEGKGLSKAQAEALLKDWEVVTHYTDRTTSGESSFGATLFYSKEKGYVLGLKGTAELYDDLIGADGGDIVADGLAMDQIIDMYNFWKQINTAKGETYQVAVLEKDELLTQRLKSNPLLRAQLKQGGYIVDQPNGDVKKVVFKNSSQEYPDDRAFGLGISVGQVTVTGHSLGGHLSAAFSRIFPEITNESVMINGAGFGVGLAGLYGGINIANLFGTLNPKDQGFNKDIITNLTGDKGIDFVAQDWWWSLSQPGKQPELFIESGTSHTFGHGSPQMTNTLAVMNLFFLIDKELAEKPIEESLIFLNQLFKAMAFNDDITLENIVVALTKIFLKDEITIKETDRDGLYSAINKFFDSNNNFKFSGDYSIKFLVDQSSNSIVGLAQNNLAYTYALVHGNIFAIEGLDYSSFNQNGELEHYNPDTQKGSLTDRYLKDRATYIQALIEYNNGKNISDVKFTYEDLSANEKLPILTLAPNRIVFASNEGGEIKRQALGHQNWSIYGGNGVDKIEFSSDSKESSHYFEGGKGGDTYKLGGNSNIEIFDIEGSDKYIANNITGELYIEDVAGNDNYKITGSDSTSGSVTIKDFDGTDTYDFTNYAGNFSIHDLKGKDSYVFGGTSTAGNSMSVVDEEGYDTYEFVLTKDGFSKGIYNITDKDGKGKIIYNGKKIDTSDAKHWMPLEKGETDINGNWTYNSQWNFNAVQSGIDKNGDILYTLTITSYSDAVDKNVGTNIRPTVVIHDFKNGDLGINLVTNAIVLTDQNTNPFYKEGGATSTVLHDFIGKELFVYMRVVPKIGEMIYLDFSQAKNLGVSNVEINGKDYKIDSYGRVSYIVEEGAFSQDTDFGLSIYIDGTPDEKGKGSISVSYAGGNIRNPGSSNTNIGGTNGSGNTEDPNNSSNSGGANGSGNTEDPNNSSNSGGANGSGNAEDPNNPSNSGGSNSSGNPNDLDPNDSGSQPYDPRNGITGSTDYSIDNGIPSGNTRPTGEFGNAIDDAVKTGSPLIFDLDGNGITTTTLEDGVYFDHDGNGFAGKTAWVGKGDGLLVFDQNMSGQIENGQELFGNYTNLANGQKAPNGFEALKQYDTNGDGIIDENDEIYHKLQVWVDKNGDGKVDSGELLTLKEAGVAGINLGYKNSNYVDANGNYHKQQGSFITTDGKTQSIHDVWFKIDRTDSMDHTDDIVISDDIKKLPNLLGFGNVMSLHKAMMLDTTGEMKQLVSEIVETMSGNISFDSLRAKVDRVIVLWTGANKATNLQGAGAISGELKYVLEAFYGQNIPLTGGPDQALSAEKEAYQIIYNYLFDQIIYETKILGHIKNSDITKHPETGAYIINTDKLTASLVAQFNTSNKKDFYEILRVFGRVYGKDKLSLQIYTQTLKEMSEIGDVELSMFIGYFQHIDISTNNLILGDSSNNTLQGTFLNEIIYAGNGNDELYGGNGNDTFIGGKGNDLLVGGRGNKTYIFAKGDGNDTINNFDTQNTVSDDIDVIKFTNVKSDEVSYRGENYDLIIDYGNGDSIRIQGFFISGWEKIDEIHFSDGVIVTHTELQSQPITVNVSVNNYKPIWNGLLTIIGDDIGKTYNGSEGSDTIYAGAGNDTILGGNSDDILHGGDGNDIINGGMGNDTLYGGNGDDTLHGGYGNDTFIGGKGDDLLVGGRGNKTYIFAKGDGNDTINNFDTQNTVSDDIDVIKFTDVKSDEVSYRGENYDLIIDYGNGDSIRIQGFFISGWEKIDEIHFADGMVITLTDLQSKPIVVNVSVNNYEPIWNGLLTIIGDDIGKTYNGSEGSNTIYAGAGNDTISGGDGDDTLHGGDGNDIIDGGMGNDTLYGGNGDDTLYGGYGNDTFIGGKGDDLLVGGRGNKTYIFAKGDGNDTINNFDTQNTVSDDIDVIKFTDVKSDEVSYRGENYDLIIEYGNDDSIRIQGFFISGWEKIDEIHFADGNVVKQNEIQGLMDAQKDQSLARTMNMANEASPITVNQELHSLISAMASFDSANSTNDDFIVTSDQSLSKAMLTTSIY